MWRGILILAVVAPRAALGAGRRGRRSSSGSTCAAACTWCCRSRPPTRCAPRPTRTWSGCGQELGKRQVNVTTARGERQLLRGRRRPRRRRGHAARDRRPSSCRAGTSRARATAGASACSAAYERQLRDGAVQQALQTINNRVDEFGVAEPLIARQGSERSHRRAAPRRRRPRARQVADQEHRLPRVPAGRLPAAAGRRRREPRGGAGQLRRRAARERRDHGRRHPRRAGPGGRAALLRPREARR